MGALKKLVFGGVDGVVCLEFHDENTCVKYTLNDAEEAFDTMSIMAQCLAADMEAKGISYDADYEIVCQDACEGMMAKFSEPQLRAIMKVLYMRDLPSDLDVLVQELQMRMR